jgi:hypothetical protein
MRHFQLLGEVCLLLQCRPQLCGEVRLALQSHRQRRFGSIPALKRHLHSKY